MAQAKGRAFKVRETGGCLVPRGSRMLPGALSGQQATLCKPSPPSPALFSPPSAAAAGGVLRNHVSRKRVGRKSVAGTGALGGMPGRVLGGSAPGIVVSAHSAEVRSAGRRQARRLGWLWCSAGDRMCGLLLNRQRCAPSHTRRARCPVTFAGDGIRGQGWHSLVFLRSRVCRHDHWHWQMPAGW